MIDLREYLGQHLEAISDSADSKELQLYVLSDTYDAPEMTEEFGILDYSPRRFRNEFLAKRHLVLIYQGPLIVLGMTLFEYAYISSAVAGNLRYSRSYLQYVDSTGLYSERKNQSHLTKSLVKAYFQYCKECLKVKSVHLLACAKPAFLFAGSEFNEEKRALPSAKLVNWWLEVVKGAVSEQEGTQVHVYSPVEEADGSNRMKKRVGQFNEKSKAKWSYGLAYGSTKALVTDVIPLFEDDPKWRHYEATVLEDDDLIDASERKHAKRPRIIESEDEVENKVADDNAGQKALKSDMNLKDFFESIQVRPEFRSETSAFITITFASDDRLRDELPPSSNELKVNKSDLATFGCKMLAGLTFESGDAARKSSAKIMGWMRLMGVKPAVIKKIKLEDLGGFGEDRENLLPVNNSIRDENKFPVNSIQSLIKKKPKSAGI